MSNNKGFSLVELILAMAIFIVVMLITSYAFEHILKSGGQQGKSAETDTAGIVGLEMLRGDLEHLGYGIPWAFQTTPSTNFNEATGGGNTPVTGINAADYNEGLTPPKAIQLSINTTGKILDNSGTTNPGAAYIVIKSTRVALHDTARKWSYVNYSASGGTNASYIKQWNTTDDFKAGERVITISSTYSPTGVPSKTLVMDSAASGAARYSYSISGSPPFNPSANYRPGDSSMTYVVYGVGADPAVDLRMPYNRADYYVKKSTANMPLACNPGTGILYKGVVQQGAGNFVEYPLLNCVGDMQVEFELDPNNNGNISITPTLGTMSAADIRSQLKTVKVFILAHEGTKDPNYTYNKDSVQVGDPSRASSGQTRDSTWLANTFGTDWRNYRWKVYSIVVHPKNLN